MNIGTNSCLCAILILAAGCADDVEKLPPLVASSKYIDYHTDANASVICMDDLLAREDRFIEQTAATLGVEVPTGTIHYVWEPVRDFRDPKPWACKSLGDCYRYRENENYGLIVSSNVSNHHELVHTVEIPALGQSGYQTLGEGLAEYLGSSKSSEPAQVGFPEAFKAMVARGPQSVDYRLALHFVGSLFSRHGAEKYRELRVKMPGNAGLEQFAAAFEIVYGQALDDALDEMGDDVRAVDQPAGCVEGEGREISWTSAESIETTIESSCGDGAFFGGGFADGRPGFGALFVIEVPKAGYYDLTIRGVGGESGQFQGSLTTCSLGMPGGSVASAAGATGRGLLYPGKHTLLIGFPSGPEARGEATLRLEYIEPPPP